MTQIPLFISDVDRTILTHDHVLPPRVVSAFADLNDAGLRTTLATARSPKGVAQYASALNIIEPCICFNGAWIGNPNTLEAVHSETLDLSLAREAMNFAAALGIATLWYSKSEVYATSSNEIVLKETATTGEPLRIVSDLAVIEEAPFKLMCVAWKLADQKKFNTIIDQFGSSISAARSHDRLLELSPRSVDKALASRILCKRLGIEISQIAAAGDAANDLSLLRSVAIPITVSNALPEIRKIAHFVGPSCDEGGLADAISWLLNNSKTSQAKKGTQHA